MIGYDNWQESGDISCLQILRKKRKRIRGCKNLLRGRGRGTI